MNLNGERIRFFGKAILFGIGALVFAAVIALLFGWVLMLLWNWLMPPIFGLTSITYLQAWGLILLSHLLFKGGPGGHRPPVGRSHVSGRGGPLFGSGDHHTHHSRKEMDAFKKEFRDRMRRHWHGDPHDEECCGDLRKDEAVPEDDSSGKNE